MLGMLLALCCDGAVTSACARCMPDSCACNNDIQRLDPLHACADILEADGTQHLVVTHKSILRALLCVALNLPPVSFRAFDIHNAGVCTFRYVAAKGALLLSSCMTRYEAPSFGGFVRG